MPVVITPELLITKHEGYRRTVYVDTKGHPTVGIGFNLDDPSAAQTCVIHGLNLKALLAGAPISLPDAAAVRDDQILAAKCSAITLIPRFDSLADNAQAVVLDMIFNLGEKTFKQFQGVIAALNAEPPDYEGASNQMRNSEWYHQVESRSIEDCMLMLECENA